MVQNLPDVQGLYRRSCGDATVRSVAHVEKITAEDATGTLARQLQAAQERAGRVWEIVAVQSQNAESLAASMRMYGSLMFGDSPLSRAQREMIAVVTSQANDCHY